MTAPGAAPIGGQRTRARPWLPGIRVRITAVATAAVAVVLVGTAAALVGVQRRELTAAIDARLAQRADDLAVLVTSRDRLPHVLPATGDDTTVAQVVDGRNRVLAASRGLRRPLGGALGSAEQRDTYRVLHVPGFDDPFRTLTRQVPGRAVERVVIVGQNLDDVRETTAILAGALAVAVPVATIVLAGLVWYLVGRTLRPVEAIRAEVAAMSGRELDRRVPQPPGDDEIVRLAATVNQMLARLQTAVVQQRQLVADVAHELRTPLARARAELEVELAHGAGDDPGVGVGDDVSSRVSDDADSATGVAAASVLRSVLDEVDALQRVVDDVLLLARSDAGTDLLRIGPVDLDVLVLDEVRQARDDRGGTGGNRGRACGDRGGADHRERRVHIDVSGVSGAAVDGDAGQLRRAIRNLIDNAVRHAETEVTLALSERDDHVRLTVGNDGAAIPVDARERIFDRFVRLDDARARDAGGSGLGLAIARTIVERHGGRVHVDPDRTDGAAFVVSLPLLGRTAGWGWRREPPTIEWCPPAQEQRSHDEDRGQQRGRAQHSDDPK